MTAFRCPQETKGNLKCIFKNEPEGFETAVDVRLTRDKLETKLQCKNEEIQFNSIIIKGYTSCVAKEEPVSNINSLFQDENNLYVEKKQFHQKIVSNILLNIVNLQIKEIETVYTEHLQKIADLETFTCSSCDYRTIQKENLRNHLLLIHKQHMDSRWFGCPSCDYKQQSLEHIKHHFEQSHCDKTKIKTLQKRKPKKKINKKKFECDLCSFDCDELESFDKHKGSHKDPEKSNRFVCYSCNYGHTNKTNLARHLLKSHGIVTKRASQIRELKCNLCEYTCNTTQYLNRHMISHENPDKATLLSCKYCDFKTKYRMSLSYHMRNHSMTEEQLRTYMCEICSKRFKQKSKLDLHVITHKSIDEVSRIYKCSECPFQAKIKRNLEMHMAVHKEPEFVCDVCGHRSKRKDAHNRHKFTHKEDSAKLYKCTLCSYETHIKCYLKKHFKKHSNSS